MNKDRKIDLANKFILRNMKNLAGSVDYKINLRKSHENEFKRIKLNDSPGPGQYSLPSSNSGPKFSFYSKLTFKSSTYTPGPGTYMLHKVRVACTKFSPLKVQKLSGDCQKLGPGSYTPTLKAAGPKWGFGASKRSKIVFSESPGPGSYNVPNLSSVRAFSIYPKIREASLCNSPGPGTYDPKILDSSPKFSLYSKLPHKFNYLTPGPGTYLLL